VKYDVSRLIDFDGKTHDMCVITKWDEEGNFERDPIVIDYYFGDYDKEVTDTCIDIYLEKQKGLKDGLKFLEGEYLINCIDGDFMEPEQKEELKNSIEVIKQLV
jgi:hypothetical protein